MTTKPLELEFQVLKSCLTWVLGPELGSSKRAVSALNCRFFSLAPHRRSLIHPGVQKCSKRMWPGTPGSPRSLLVSFSTVLELQAHTGTRLRTWVQELNSGPHTYTEDTLPMRHFASSLVWLFMDWLIPEPIPVESYSPLSQLLTSMSM